jgi:hypothetical protein
MSRFQNGSKLRDSTNRHDHQTHRFFRLSLGHSVTAEEGGQLREEPDELGVSLR